MLPMCTMKTLHTIDICNSEKKQTRFRFPPGVTISGKPGVMFFTGRWIFSKLSLTKNSRFVLFFILNLKIFKDQACSQPQNLPWLKASKPVTHLFTGCFSARVWDWRFNVSSMPYIWPSDASSDASSDAVAHKQMCPRQPRLVVWRWIPIQR